MRGRRNTGRRLAEYADSGRPEMIRGVMGAPRVSEVGLGVHQEAIGEHLRQQLKGKYVKICPFAQVDEVSLHNISATCQ